MYISIYVCLYIYISAYIFVVSPAAAHYLNTLCIKLSFLIALPIALLLRRIARSPAIQLTESPSMQPEKHMSNHVVTSWCLSIWACLAAASLTFIPHLSGNWSLSSELKFQCWGLCHRCELFICPLHLYSILSDWLQQQISGQQHVTCAL